MKKVTKMAIIICFIAITIFGYSIPCFAATPAITQEQQEALSNYVRTYVREAAKNSYTYYTISHDSEASCNNEASEGGQIAFCCASFCSAMLYQALDAKEVLNVALRKVANLRATSFFKPGKTDLFTELTNEDILVPGDIITYSGYRIHALIYIGCDPETGVHQLADVHSAETGVLINLPQFTPNTPIRYREFVLRTKWGQVSRLKPEFVPEDWEAKKFINWPNGGITPVDNSFTLTNWIEEQSELFYNGIADMTYEGMAKTWLEMAVESLGQIFDYLLGTITYLLKMPIIAIAQIIETLLNWVLQIFSGTDTLQMITIEEIIFNRVPLLNINLFQTLPQDMVISTSGVNIIEVLRTSITAWYYIFRYIVIIAMLLTLIYLGVRMAITSIAEDKAKYKKLLVDWFVSFIIIFVIHYYAVIVIQGNEFLLNIFQTQIDRQEQSGIMDDFDSAVIEKEDTTTTTENTSGDDAASSTDTEEEATGSVLSTQSGLFNRIREMAYSFKFTEGFLGAIAYLILVYYTIKFCIKYIKRMFNVYILIILSPLIAVSYAFDKIKDGKSQSLSKWMKELGFGVLVQSVHALIYTIFVSIILLQINSANILNLSFTCVLMFITFNFMDKAEQLFENIFNMKTDSIATATATLEGYATVKSIKGVLGGYKTVGKTAVQATGKLANKIPAVAKTKNKISDKWNEAKYGDTATNKGENSSVDDKIEKERKTVEKQQKELKAQRKAIRKEAMKTVGNLLATIPQMVDNPGTGFSILISGITGIQSTNRKIRSYKKKTVTTYKTDNYAKIKALNARRDSEIYLKSEMANLLKDKESIIGRGFVEGATQQEKEASQKAMQILEEKIAQTLEQTDVKDVKEAVDKAVIENDGKIDSKTLNEIIDELQAKNEKEGSSEELSESSSEKLSEELTEESKEKSKKEELNENVDAALVGMMTEQAFTKSKQKQSFTGPTAIMIKQAKEQLEEKLKKEAMYSKMSKSEKRENLERGLRQELEAYVKKQQSKNEILNDIKKEELESMIVSAMNSENSILTQLYSDKGIKSTSNEQTDLGSQTIDENSKVYSNVEMRKNKENSQEAVPEGPKASVVLREVGIDERLKGEMRPVLEAAAQLREANAELQKISRKDSKIKLDEVIGELRNRRNHES